MQIQSLYRDIREHRELFIKAPLARAWAHREYRQGIGCMLGLLLLMPLFGLADVLYEQPFVTLLTVLPLLLMAVRCRGISDREQVLLIEETFGVLPDTEVGDRGSLGAWERYWFCQRYRSQPSGLASLAFEMEQDWSDWQRIRSRAGDLDANELLDFFFGRMDSNRLTALLAILLTIICTLVVTYGEGAQAYFELFAVLQDRGWQLLLLLAWLCMLLGLLRLMFRDLLRGLGTMLFEQWGSYGISDRGVYRYLRQMIWVGGIEGQDAARSNSSSRHLQSLLDLAYMPIGQLLRRLIRLRFPGIAGRS